MEVNLGNNAHCKEGGGWVEGEGGGVPKSPRASPLIW